MAYLVLLVLLVLLQFGSGQSSHKHLDEDHYTGQQHNPEHDMNALLGEEVPAYLLSPFYSSSFFITYSPLIYLLPSRRQT